MAQGVILEINTYLSDMSGYQSTGNSRERESMRTDVLPWASPAIKVTHH